MVVNRQKGWVKFFVFLPQKFCGSSAEEFVIFMVVQGCLLFCSFAKH